MAKSKTQKPEVSAERGAMLGDLLAKHTPPKAGTKPTAPANGAVTEEMVLAYLEAQHKGSEILKKARNVVWRKIAQRDAKPELVEVFRQAVQLHGYNECKLAWNVIRKENTPAKAETEPAESE